MLFANFSVSNKDHLSTFQLRRSLLSSMVTTRAASSLEHGFTECSSEWYATKLRITVSYQFNKRFAVTPKIEPLACSLNIVQLCYKFLGNSLEVVSKSFTVLSASLVSDEHHYPILFIWLCQIVFGEICSGLNVWINRSNILEQQERRCLSLGNLSKFT